MIAFHDGFGKFALTEVGAARELFDENRFCSSVNGHPGLTPRIHSLQLSKFQTGDDFARRPGETRISQGRIERGPAEHRNYSQQKCYNKDFEKGKTCGNPQTQDRYKKETL